MYYFKQFKYMHVDKLLQGVNDSNGVICIPALAGLLSPYWKSNIKGAFLGLTLHTTKGELLRSVIEAICFQVKEVLI